jgi:hypothetical protein
MIGALIVATALAAAQNPTSRPAKPATPQEVAADARKADAAKPARKSKTPSERHQEERSIRTLLEGKANRPVTPGEILFVGPPPGESSVVALSPQRGCDQMVNLFIPSPGNQYYAAAYAYGAANSRPDLTGLEYGYVYVPFKSRAVGTEVREVKVCDLMTIRGGESTPRGVDGPRSGSPIGLTGVAVGVVPLYTIPVPITQVMPLEGPLKDRPIWVLHANFYNLDKKAADLSYPDRVKLWESLANKPTRTKSRARQLQKKPAAAEVGGGG